VRFSALLPTLFATAALSAQDSTPAFEVASVKPAVPGSKQQLTIQPGGRLSASGFALQTLIAMAYHLPAYRLSGADGWMANDNWTIEAKAGDVDQVPKWSPPYLPEAIAVRVRALLEDRFALKTHRETREMRAYSLALGKAGSRMIAADPAPAGTMAAGPGVVKGFGATMDQFVTYLNRILDLPVIDRTGISGSFQFELHFAPESTHPLSTPEASASADPSIFVALDEQLGLTLKPSRESVDVLVVDSARKPRAD
jgi:uncharacterized protein (TIGR03435 family)